MKMKKKYRKLSVIIPAYNEEKTMLQVLEKVREAKLPAGLEKEMIVVDDCSTDRTAERVREFVRLHADVELKYLKHEQNRGKGKAVRTGLEVSTGDIIIIQDADLECDPNEFSLLLPPLLSGAYKVVYGSRTLNKENRYSYRTFYWGGKFVSYVASVLFGQKITDEPTCYKLFDASLLKSIPLTCDGFGFCPEVTAKVMKRGYRIKEVPISYHPRSIQEGKKVQWIDGVEAIAILLKYRLLPTDWEQAKGRSVMRYVGNKLLLNVVAGCVAFFCIWAGAKCFPSYTWVHKALLVENYKVASANKHLTPDQVREVKLGFNFSYLMFIKERTPDDAVIWMPESKAYFPEGKDSPFTREILSKLYRLRVLHPRKVVDAVESGNKYAQQITHVAIIHGQGAEKLNYSLGEVPDYALYPVNDPFNKSIE